MRLLVRTVTLSLCALATLVASGSALAGQLVVTSDPPGAQVLVNGEPRGVTPLNVDVQATAVQQCEVLVSLAGYHPIRMAYTAVPGQFETLHFYLLAEGEEAVGPVPPEGEAVPRDTRLGPPSGATAPAPPSGDRALREWLGDLLGALRLI